jgi:hypothetical protein
MLIGMFYLALEKQGSKAKHGLKKTSQFLWKTSVRKISRCGSEWSKRLRGGPVGLRRN